jgi:hypothetical protein
MRTKLRSKVTLLFMAFGLMVATAGVAWADATLDTSASLSTDVNAPSQVGIGNNPFTINVWAFAGNIPASKDGQLNVVNRYVMNSSTGAITPDTSSTTLVDFSSINYGSGTTQPCQQNPVPQGCPSNPFVVNATLVVPSGTPNGTTGVLQVAHTHATSESDSGLDLDLNPATGQVEVFVPSSCSFSEIRPPVNDVSSATEDGMSAYKAGSKGVIPAKFQATCANSLVDTQAEADANPMYLSLKLLGSLSGGTDTELEPTVTGSANTGNLFRFDDASDQYIYNLNIKGLAAGVYSITISDGKGGSQTDWFAIK